MSRHDENDSRGAQAVATSITFTVIAGATVGLRLAARLMIVHNSGSEDWMTLVAFFFSIALTVLICLEVQHGMGRHYDTLSDKNIVALLKAFWASVPVYQTALTLTKFSLLLQYHRVFVGQRIRRAILVMLGVTLLYGLWSIVGTTFMCTPVSYFWNSTNQKGHCLNKTAVWFSNASLNILTDICILIIPMPVLKSLRLPTRQKFGLIVVFGLGGFVCLTSIMRLHSLYVISASTDVTWDNVAAAYWSSIETNVGIVCACLPTLKPILRRFFPGFFLTDSTPYRAQEAVSADMFAKTRRAGYRANSNVLRSHTSTNDLQMKNVSGRNSKEEGSRKCYGGENQRIEVLTVITQEVQQRNETDTISETCSERVLV